MSVPENLPGPIIDMVSKLHDKKMNVYVRSNYRATLQAIVDYCQKSIKKFDNEYTKENTKVRSR